MDALSALAIAKVCTNAPAIVVAAIALVQTKGEPFSVGVSGEISTYSTFDKAMQTASAGEANKEFVQVGIALVSLQELKKRGLSLTDGFSACRNLHVAGQLITTEWQQLGSKESDWLRAATAYAVGHPDAGEVNNFTENYKKRYEELKALEPQLSSVSTAKQSQPDGSATKKAAPETSSLPGRSVDVFERSAARERPLRFAQ